jgi:hypothetical protein
MVVPRHSGGYHLHIWSSSHRDAVFKLRFDGTYCTLRRPGFFFDRRIKYDYSDRGAA